MEKTFYTVIDNDTKEAVSVETPCLKTAQNWAQTFNDDCHACGGSLTQYGVDEVQV